MKNGKSLRQICKIAGIDYQEVLSYIGETPMSIALIERGQRRLSIAATRKFDEVFGIDMAESAGISTMLLSMIERGTRPMTQAVAQKCERRFRWTMQR
jgi:hypothetical protein